VQGSRQLSTVHILFLGGGGGVSSYSLGVRAAGHQAAPSLLSLCRRNDSPLRATFPSTRLCTLPPDLSSHARDRQGCFPSQRLRHTLSTTCTSTSK